MEVLLDCYPDKLLLHLLAADLNGFYRSVVVLLDGKRFAMEICHLGRAQIPGANPGPQDSCQGTSPGAIVTAGLFQFRPYLALWDLLGAEM